MTAQTEPCFPFWISSGEPLVGRLMATLVAEVRDGRDHDRDPVQLLLPRTGHTIDLATFSRLRTTSDDGPRSVMG